MNLECISRLEIHFLNITNNKVPKNTNTIPIPYIGIVKNVTE